jgi:hypothetical protein
VAARLFLDAHHAVVELGLDLALREESMKRAIELTLRLLARGIRLEAHDARQVHRTVVRLIAGIEHHWRPQIRA